VEVKEDLPDLKELSGIRQIFVCAINGMNCFQNQVLFFAVFSKTIFKKALLWDVL